MSEENVEIVRRAVEAFEREGLDGSLRHYDPEIEWSTTEGASIEAATYRGHEGVRRYFGHLDDEFDDLRFEVQELIEAGDQVILTVRAGGRGKTSGAPVELTMSRRLHAAGRHDRPHAQLRGQGRGPRSRRAVGVGDVAGERGKAPEELRRVQRSLEGAESAGGDPRRRGAVRRSRNRVGRRGDRASQPIYHGVDGVIEFFDPVLDAFEQVRQVPERFIDCGDQVLVFVRTEARARTADLESMSFGRTWSPCETARSLGWSSSETATKPSKPPGWGSRRCRGKRGERARGIDAWNRGDLDGWLAGFAPEAEWHTTGLFADRGRLSRAGGAGAVLGGSPGGHRGAERFGVRHPGYRRQGVLRRDGQGPGQAERGAGGGVRLVRLDIPRWAGHSSRDLRGPEPRPSKPPGLSE